MTYFDHRRPQQPYQPTFRQEPVTAYPVDEDGDRVYTEEDYAVPPDGDAFLPDAEDEDALYADPVIPYGNSARFGYDGAYGSFDESDEDWEDSADLPYDEDLLTEEELAEIRRNNWRLLANLADFGAVILGTAFILVLLALLFSLVNWLVNDIAQTFTLLQMPM
ncbi:MAG: hypothetical protein IJE07_01620 [Clostridia bacterium]|nr:hypothetical protein [Clostridia bacterium]